MKNHELYRREFAGFVERRLKCKGCGHTWDLVCAYGERPECPRCTSVAPLADTRYGNEITNHGFTTKVEYRRKPDVRR